MINGCWKAHCSHWVSVSTCVNRENHMTPLNSAQWRHQKGAEIFQNSQNFLSYFTWGSSSSFPCLSIVDIQVGATSFLISICRAPLSQRFLRYATETTVSGVVQTRTWVRVMVRNQCNFQMLSSQISPIKYVAWSPAIHPARTHRKPSNFTSTNSTPPTFLDAPWAYSGLQRTRNRMLTSTQTAPWRSSLSQANRSGDQQWG